MNIIQEGRVLYKFGAAWCGLCRQINPILDSLKSEGLNIIDIDIDKEQDLAQEYSIRSVPTLIMFENGKEVSRVVGFQSKEQIKDLYNKNKG